MAVSGTPSAMARVAVSRNTRTAHASPRPGVPRRWTAICGAGAPRFNIQTTNGKSYFIGCMSPPANTIFTGTGWVRLRWGVSGVVTGYNAATGVPEAITSPVKSIQIVFDEGQDTPPDQFGLAVLDNIDINGVLVGHGPTGPGNGNGNGNGNGDDEDGKDK